MYEKPPLLTRMCGGVRPPFGERSRVEVGDLLCGADRFRVVGRGDLAPQLDHGDRRVIGVSDPGHRVHAVGDELEVRTPIRRDRWLSRCLQRLAVLAQVEDDMQPSGVGGRDEGVDAVPGGARLRVRQRVVPGIELDELERVEIGATGERDLVGRVAVLPVRGCASFIEPRAIRAQPVPQTVTKDEAGGFGIGVWDRRRRWARCRGRGWRRSVGGNVAGVGGARRTGCSPGPRALAGGRAGLRVARTGSCPMGRGGQADSEMVAPHAAVAIRTTVAAERVLIIWAPVAGTHDPSVTRLSRGETRGFASPPHGDLALVVASTQHRRGSCRRSASQGIRL